MTVRQNRIQVKFFKARNLKEIDQLDWSICIIDEQQELRAARRRMFVVERSHVTLC